MTGTRSRRPVPDRARKRAIRALATELGVAYSVAARLLTAETAAPAGDPDPGLPTDGDEHRTWMFAAREQRTFHSRVSDTRLAADLPLGRAAHLARRFPPLRAAGAPGRLYDGEGRETVIAMLYAVLVHEAPGLLPPVDELAWAAELGEETAVDFAVAALDRAARRLLDDDRWRLWARIEAALAAGETGSDRPFRDACTTLGRELRSTSLRGSVGGARHILDAVLAEPHGAHPPGARVVAAGRRATVVGARWQQPGPPTAYEIHVDGEPGTRTVAATGLTPTSSAGPETSSAGPEPVPR